MIAQIVTKIRSLFSNGNSLSTAAFAFSRSVILTSVVVTGVVGGVRLLGTLEGMELGAYDQLMRSRPDRGPDDRLLVVGVTEEDIQSRREYPLNDGTLAELLEKLQQYQPRAIGIDILRDVPQGDSKGRIALQKILQQSDNLIAVCKLSSADQPGIASAPGVPEDRVGFADLPVDPGGTLRRSLLLSTPAPSKVPLPSKHLCNIPDPENQLPAFGFQLAMLYLEAEAIQPEPVDDGKAIKILSTVFRRLEEQAGGYHKADAGNYQLMLNYRSAKNAVKQVSLTEVLQGKIDPAWVRDRVVLVGYTAPIVKDDFYTPYSAGQQDDQKMPGVVIHAQHVSQILSAVLNNRPLIWYWPEPAEWLWILGWSLLGGTLAWGIRRLWIFGVGVVVAIGVLYGTCYVLFLSAGWVPLVPPALALVATAVGVVLVDRGYAKAIYQGVKKVILNIEIDEAKKQQQVAAITESESFVELEKKAQELRKNRNRDRRSRDAELANTETDEATPTPPAAEPAQEDDYLQQLQKKGKKLKNTDEQLNSRDSTANTETEEATPPEAEPTQEDDYLQQLQKRGKKLRNTDEPSNSSDSAANTETEEASPTAPEAEPTQEDDYLQQLQKRGKKLRNTDE
jgi:CHASE2 domain-containing sensor protein